MTDLTIDGEIFRVEVEGDSAQPVLLLSGSLGADLSMWDAQMPAFLAHFRVVRYDPRGHGRSTREGAPYSLARLGADVLAILDALAIERTHFLGLSMGGAVGQWLLVNAPERIDRAVLANTNARFAPSQLWNERILSVLSKGTQALAAATMERWFSKGFRAGKAETVAAIDRVFRATSREGYAASSAALRDMDMREALRAVDRPVLLLTGVDDSIASAADIATMLDAIPGARHVELDCKHISNIEAQTAFDAAVVAFLTAPVRAGKTRPPKAAATPATRRLAGRRTAVRSPLKRAGASVAPARRRPAVDPARAVSKPARTKTSPRKAARPASPRRVSPVVARLPVAKAVPPKPASAKSPVRKAKPAVKSSVPSTPKPRRGAALSAATRKAVAKKAVTKKAVTKKAVTKKGGIQKNAVKKAAAKKTVKKATTAKKVIGKPAARRPTKKQPGRSGGRSRR